MPNATTIRIPLGDIIPDPGQPRQSFDEAELAELAADLRARGQINPLAVRFDRPRGKYVIIAGERRFRAMGRAGFDAAECRVYDGQLSETEVLELQLAENLHRKDLNALEEARSYARLLALKGCTSRELADGLHVSPARICRALSLLELPPEIQEMVRAGAVPAGVGYELARLEDVPTKLDLADRVARGLLTRDAVVKRVQAQVGKRDYKGKSAALIVHVNGTSATFTSKSGTLDINKLYEMLAPIWREVKKLREKKCNDAAELAKCFEASRG
jgi:ParB family chromosome partitioning protein